LTSPRLCFLLLILLCLAGMMGAPARALQSSPPEGGNNTAKTTQAQSPAEADDQGSEEDVYRHSPSVTTIGGWLHLDQEAAARLFEYVNFAVLAGVILFFAGKHLPKTFRENREQIRRQLVEARIATEHAQERLTAIEQRLARLGEEIAVISKQAEKDSVGDEARIKASIESERESIVAASTRDIAAAANAAQRELKRFAAGLAVDRAAQRLVLTADDDRELVQEFSQSLGMKNGGKN
jgi:F-type H+-transporting ATPase subunit b